ncbi:hypothetical protein GQ472_01620 [archaeon]|nr:hypothetical protein [archaeon]
MVHRFRSDAQRKAVMGNFRSRLPRVVVGKHKGIKVRLRYPSEMAGYITYTFASISEANRYLDSGWVSDWAKRRAKITRL